MWCRCQSHHWTPRSLSRPYRAESTPGRPSPAPAWGSGSAWWSDRWAERTRWPSPARSSLDAGTFPFGSKCARSGWRNRCQGRSKRTCPWTYWSAHTSWQTLCRRSCSGSNRYCVVPSCGPRRKQHSRTYRVLQEHQCCPWFLHAMGASCSTLPRLAHFPKRSSLASVSLLPCKGRNVVANGEKFNLA